MATNYVQDGDHVTYTVPSGGVVAGDVVVLGGIIGVALHDAAAATESELDISGGVWDLTKTASNTFAYGAQVYWDATAKSATSTSSGNTACGRAVKVAAANDATVRVRLPRSF